MVKLCRKLGLAVLVLLMSVEASAATLRVGPREAIRNIAAAAARAQDGDTVEIVAGTYVGDVAVWSQKHLTIRGLGGRVWVIAAGRSAEEKGIWVIRGEDVLVENIAFKGARVRHRNGAGIRHEEGKLTVRNCLFDDNEMGILTANHESLTLIVENSEFSHGVIVTPRVSHLLYAGHIGRLEVRGSYFHHGLVGHLLKSRARFNLIEYNRLTDEAGGRASYEMDFPDGGVAILIGNLVRQSAGTENNRIVAFGAEGLRYSENVLIMANNTLVDDVPAGGEFVRVWSPEQVSVKAYNNLLIGGCVGLACVEEAVKRGSVRLQAGRLPWGDDMFPEDAGNVHVRDPAWRARLKMNGFHPEFGVKWPVGPVAPGGAYGMSLVPGREYVHRAGLRVVGRGERPAVIGAFRP
jgi:hypothetical protein